jgi:hypothetical protein
LGEKVSADGAAGERWASTLLTAAVCAQAMHATSDEDDDKLDLKLSFEHAFRTHARISAHCQVKSGPSWLSSANTKAFHLKNIDERTIDALRNGTRPSLLVWVPPAPRSGAFWYAFGLRRSDRTPLKIPRWHRISPALRYDLTRVFEMCTRTRQANRLDVSREVAGLKDVKSAYARLAKTYHHPLMGVVNVTRFGWRHVTRLSKPKKQRQQALRLVPYLPGFLTHAPDRFSMTCDPLVAEGSELKRRAWIWCWYRNALRIDDVPHRLLIRFREEVRFPARWWDRPLSVTDVKQSAVLESWWSKPEIEPQSKLSGLP